MNNQNRNRNADGVWEISPEELMQVKQSVKIIDVRREEEFYGELGHIEGSELCTLQTKFQTKVSEFSAQETFVFVCRSGQRSSMAAMMAMDLGIMNVYNLTGGMLAWNEKKLPVVLE